jgi:tetratricopeptide (TPR) repeat protein
MNRRGSIWVVTLFVGAALLAGCHTDPNVRKQKYLESGKRYAAANKYKEAAIQFSNALKIDKAYPEAHYELALAYEHLGEYPAAYSELVRTVTLQPANYKARVDLGNLSLAGGKTDDAQTQANAVMAAQPNNPDVHALLSAIAVRRGQRDLALTEIHRALELDPGRSAFHESLAILEGKDPTKVASVEDELKKAVALDPKSVNARLLLGSFYSFNNRWAEAEKVNRDAIATDPKNLAARESLAGVFLKQGNQAKAEEVLRQASIDFADNPQGVRLLADYYTRSRQMDKAKAEFASLASKYPKNVPVLKGYTRVLLQVGDFSTAQTVIASLLKVGGNDPEVLALNGIVLLNSGKANDAVNALQEAAKNFPKDAFTQYWLGKAALAKGDNALAEKSFRQSAELNPEGLEAQQELARIAAQLGDMNLLGEVADKTIAAVPAFAGGYVWRAIAEMSRNTLDKAEADLKKAMEVAPQSPQAYLQLGKLRFAQKKYPEGAALEEKALQLDPGSIEAIRLLVGYDLYEKHPDKALARLNDQIAKNPNSSALLDLLAEFQIETKNLDQAFAAAQKAMTMNPNDGEAVTLYTQIQVQRGQVVSAIGAWEQWLKVHPSDARVMAILGTLEESRGDLNKAEAYYTKALQLQPQQPIAANNLAYRMLEKGANVDVALSLAQTARQGMPNSPNTADTLAWAYYYKGTYGFARDLLEDALKADPNSATAEYHLGMVYSKLRDKTNAAAHLKKAISLAPGSPTAKSASAALNGLG